MCAAFAMIVVVLATSASGSDPAYSRAAFARVDEIDAGASVGVLPDGGVQGFLREVGRRLFPALAEAGKRVHIERAADPLLDVLLEGADMSVPDTESFRVTTQDLRGSGISEAFISNRDVVVLVDGAGRVGVLLGTRGSGALIGVARRPGIVTPGDIVATVLERLGVDPEGIPGVPLREAGSQFDGAALRARLERDSTYGPGLAWAAVLAGFGAIALAALAVWRGRRALARRAAFASALVPVGFLVGTFVPSGSAWVRAIPIGAALLVGAASKPSDRAVGWVGLGTALAICALAVAAELRPGGEPALSLWGNPLTQGRFFGLRNMFVAFVTGGIVLAAGARILRGRWLAVVGLGAAVVVGAPTIGANFAGVLTLALAVALTAILARDATRLRWTHLGIAAATGVLAMGTALAADSGSPVSHGGRAVGRVSDGGLRALADILGSRWRLNVAEVTDLGAPGYLGVLIVVGALAALTVWGARNLPGALPASILGGAVAALVAIVIEDSGFFTGGIISLFPAIVWILAATADHGDGPSPQPAAAHAA